MPERISRETLSDCFLDWLALLPLASLQALDNLLILLETMLISNIDTLKMLLLALTSNIDVGGVLETFINQLLAPINGLLGLIDFSQAGCAEDNRIMEMVKGSTGKIGKWSKQLRDKDINMSFNIIHLKKKIIKLEQLQVNISLMREGLSTQIDRAENKLQES